jgi:hypothetical protein
MNNNGLISGYIHATNHELEETEFKIILINVVNKRISVQLFGIRKGELTIFTGCELISLY